MAAEKNKFTKHDLQVLKHFRSLRKLLVRLHGFNAARDKAGSRELFMDQYCVLVLVWLFNPLIKSLRGLQRTPDMAKVRKRLGVTRSSLRSLFESEAIFDPDPLARIIAEVAHKLHAVRPGRFDVVRQKLTAVGGSGVTTLARLVGLMRVVTRAFSAMTSLSSVPAESTSQKPDLPVRLVAIAATRHRSHGGYGRRHAENRDKPP